MPADVSQLRTLVTDLTQVPPKVARGVPPVVKKGLDNVKKTMQADFSRSRSFGHIAKTITYEVKSDGGGVGGEAGPDKSRGGGARLAHIAYWGGANGGGGTVRDPAEALLEEGDRFEQALSKLLDGVL